MTPTDVIEILAAANPLPRGVAAALPLPAGESELLRGIVADRSGATAPAVRVHHRGRRKLALGLAVAVAAALVRFANSTPRLLLQIPGWHVVFVEQDPGGGGEMHFARGRVNAQGMP